MSDNRNTRNDRIDVQFNDDRFKEILKRWKLCCGVLEGGQTNRLQEIITEDLKKVLPLASAKLGNSK